MKHKAARLQRVTLSGGQDGYTPVICAQWANGFDLSFGIRSFGTGVAELKFFIGGHLYFWAFTIEGKARWTAYVKDGEEDKLEFGSADLTQALLADSRYTLAIPAVGFTESRPWMSFTVERQRVRIEVVRLPVYGLRITLLGKKSAVIPGYDVVVPDGHPVQAIDTKSFTELVEEIATR